MLHRCLTICAAILLSLAVRADAEKGPDPANHWAWKAPVRPPLPHVKNADWVRNPIDAFVLARLEAAGLKPAQPASRETWIRRVTFDLIGLPPTPGEIDAFLRDDSPDAWDNVVERLLVSPHYGERWGRHWLDLARYADTNGFEHDEVRPDAWRYRDYVVRSFNADKPYDQFIREQLAGDELAPGNPDALTATGFNLLGPDMTDAASQRQRRQNTLDDMTDTTSFVFLGLTVACARCHNHKFEPITIHDYYRMQAFFAPSEFRRDLVVADASQRTAHEKRLREFQELTGPTRAALDAMEAPYRKKLLAAHMAKLAEAAQIAHKTPEAERTGAQIELFLSTQRFLVIPPKELTAALPAGDRAEHERLASELKKWEAKKPTGLPTAMGLAEQGKPAKTFVLWRGELSNPANEVEPGFLSTVSIDADAKITSPSPRTSGRRSALAAWIASPTNPLTARVIVNRLWQHHFGRGIVATPSDFGVRGTRPTHPELLDWLAREFVERGWSLKQMHRLMLLSATYRQSTLAHPETAETDPANDLFGRMNRVRLEAEPVRDSLLAIAGRLNRKMGGPGIVVPLPAADHLGTKDKGHPDATEHVRRTVYLFARRNLRLPFLEPFDLPDSNLSCAQRERSTAAPQALALLNATDVAVTSKAFAARLEREAATAEERIVLAYRLALGRRPTPTETRLTAEFLQESPLSELCRALINVNEFVYID